MRTKLHRCLTPLLHGGQSIRFQFCAPNKIKSVDSHSSLGATCEMFPAEIWHSSSLSLWQFSPNEPELFESRLLLDSPFAGLTFAGLNFCWIHLLLVNSSPWHTPGLVAMCVDSLRSSCIVVASTLHRSRN